MSSHTNPRKALPERSIMPGEVLPNSISSELAKNRKIKHVTASHGQRCANTNQNNSGSAIRSCHLLWPLFSLKGSAMAFELSVCCGQTVPGNLRELWPALLIPHGIDCEIYPDFSPEVWSGGFLPFKVISMPAELIDAALLSPAISGFEVDIDGQHIFFSLSHGTNCYRVRSVMSLCRRTCHPY